MSYNWIIILREESLEKDLDKSFSEIRGLVPTNEKKIIEITFLMLINISQEEFDKDYEEYKQSIKKNLSKSDWYRRFNESRTLIDAYCSGFQENYCEKLKYECIFMGIGFPRTV